MITKTYPGTPGSLWITISRVINGAQYLELDYKVYISCTDGSYLVRPLTAGPKFHGTSQVHPDHPLSSDGNVIIISEAGDIVPIKLVGTAQVRVVLS